VRSYPFFRVRLRLRPDGARLGAAQEGGLMVEDASWLSIFMHVLGTADLAAASDEVSAEVVGLANGDRRSVEAARVHLISSLSDHAATHRLAMALGYLDLALRRGDDAKRWRRRSADPWSVAQRQAAPALDGEPVPAP